MNGNDEILRKDAESMVLTLVHIIAMSRYKAAHEFMTLLGYTMVFFIWRVADMLKHDRNDEVNRFISFLSQINRAEGASPADGEKKETADIIKMN